MNQEFDRGRADASVFASTAAASEAPVMNDEIEAGILTDEFGEPIDFLEHGSVVGDEEDEGGDLEEGDLDWLGNLAVSAEELEALMSWLAEGIEDENPTKFTDEQYDEVLNFMEEEHGTKPLFKYMEYADVTVDEKPRDVSEQDFAPPSQKNVNELVREGDELVGYDGGSRIVFGHFRKCDFSAPIIIKKKNWIEESGRFGEATSAKGTCLGHSLLIHGAACLAICSAFDDHYLEPLEGRDIFLKSSSGDQAFVEVTGRQFSNDRYKFVLVVNKYLILEAFNEFDAEGSRLFVRSKKEDAYNPHLYDVDAMGISDSVITKEINRVIELSSRTTKAMRDSIFKQMCSWTSRRVVRQPVNPKEDFDLERCLSMMLKYSKNGCAPSPLRVLDDPEGPSDTIVDDEIRPYVLDASVGSTYHNFPLFEDPRDTLKARTPTKLQVSYEHASIPMSSVFKELLKLDGFRSVYIEGTLMSKVAGNSGAYFDKYSGVGISWKPVCRGSPTWHMAYHRYSRPPASCGKWHLLNKDTNLHQSPTFLANRRDLQYMKVLYSKLFSMWTVMLSQVGKHEHKHVQQAWISCLGMMKTSTWQTSAVSGDSPYYTLCHMSGTGDVGSMYNEAVKKVCQPLSFSCYMFFYLLQRYAPQPLDKDNVRTPLLGLPPRLLNLEKSLPIYMNWHIRGTEHKKRCMTKIIETSKNDSDMGERLRTDLARASALLEKYLAGPVEQSEYDDYMNGFTDQVSFDAVSMLAMTESCSEGLRAGARQDATKLTLNSMISDRGCISTRRDTNGCLEVTKRKVADALSDLLKEKDNPKYALSLADRVSCERGFEFSYLLFDKDSKSSDREIPIGSIKQRVFQLGAECMASVYAEADPDDLATKFDKYESVVNDVTNTLKNGGYCRSSDKKKFCHKLWPEVLALVTYFAALCCGSTPLVLATSFLLMNKSRNIVGSDRLDAYDKIGLEDLQLASVRWQGKTSEADVWKVRSYMGQGQYGSCGGVLNTIASRGLANVQKEVMWEISEQSVATTSDDGLDGMTPVSPLLIDRKSLFDEYFDYRIKMMVRFLMEDAEKKGIKSYNFAEFNKLVIGRNGALSDYWSNACTAVQPLTGESPVDDLITVVSSARQVIFYGNSPDLAQAILYMMIIQLQTKWLFTPEHLNTLIELKLIPSSLEELISGFHIDNRNTAAAFFAMVNEELVEDVMDGTRSLASSMRKYNVREKKKKRKVDVVEMVGQSLRLRCSAAAITSSRKTGLRLNPTYMRPPPKIKRATVRDLFFDALTRPGVEISDERFEMVKRLNPRFETSVISVRPCQRLRMPVVQGYWSRQTDVVDWKKVMSRKYFNLNYRSAMNDREIAISEMGDDDFETEYKIGKRVSEFVGTKFLSITGAPTFKILNGSVFHKVRMFSFVEKLPDPKEKKRNRTIGGVDYKDVVPVSWSTAFLERLKGTRRIPAFGYSITGDDIAVMYQKKSGIPRVASLPLGSVGYQELRHGTVEVAVVIGKSYQPLMVQELDYEPIVPLLMAVSGTSDVKVNYGGWSQSSEVYACEAARGLLQKLGGNIPYFMDSLKPGYPHFPKEPVEVKYSSLVKVEGCHSVARLKLVFDSSAPRVVSVNCHGARPRVVDRCIPHVEEEFED